MRWYKRSGKRVSEKAVSRAKAAYVRAKRTGDMGGMRCSIQPVIADRVEKMSLTEFALWSGTFVWRKE